MSRIDMTIKITNTDFESCFQVKTYFFIIRKTFSQNNMFI